MTNHIKELCQAPEGELDVLQGNIAFALGCVRGGVHCVDGYPGTPSSEVIDRGLAQVQDLIDVGWSVNEAVASAVGQGHALAGRDCVVTMKIPGLFQAGDIFSSGAMFTQARGALVYYIASDFTPSSTQHTIDPRYFFKSCFVPVLEPRSHQELYESAALAVLISRQFATQVVIMPNGNLCHSEGLVRLAAVQKRDTVTMADNLRAFNVLPGMARKNHDLVVTRRMPALTEMVENNPLNRWERGSGKMGVITYGVSDLYVREVKTALDADFDVLSLAFSNPLPLNLIRKFCDSIDGPVYVIEDGARFLQESLEQAGMKVIGKASFDPLTEWTPALIAEKLGLRTPQPTATVPAPVNRPPVICAGCPYRLFAHEVAQLKKKGRIDAVFGDIGCNALLYFMNALDTGLAMGASEAMRTGYVISRPEMAHRCLSVVGDSTECHTGMAATRNAIYRNVPGVKVVLDNSWTGMTGGQPSPTSPANLAGDSMRFDLPASLKAHGANVIVAGAYQKKELNKALAIALNAAEKGVFSTVVVTEGSCLQKTPPSRQRVAADPAACKKCGVCLVCPGLETDAAGVPHSNTLCSGCGGRTPACVQMCPTHVLKAVDPVDPAKQYQINFQTPPDGCDTAEFDRDRLPRHLSLAIRGVGGQGNLFFGHILSNLAFLAGYGEANIIKGETHGMAQMGGPVISTFRCGDALSPVPLPGTVDCLIVMEKSEILRPGFLEMLKPGGLVLLASTKIVPFGLSADQYPPNDQIDACLEPYRVREVDVMEKAIALGDSSGKIANVIMLGILSQVESFSSLPEGLWLGALKQANAAPEVWARNYAAFICGREIAA